MHIQKDIGLRHEIQNDKLAQQDTNVVKLDKTILSSRQEILKKANSETNSMKFVKPRQLLVNEYPELNLSVPTFLKDMVQNVIRPSEGSALQKYIESTVFFLKNQKKERLQKQNKKIVRLHLSQLGQKLYFVDCSSVGSTNEVPFKALIDTGAANSLLHISVVNN